MLCFYSDYKITYFFYLRQFFTLYFLFFERHENRRTSFLKDIRTEEQVFFERHKNRRTCFLKDIRTEEHVLSLNQRTCSSVLLSYPRKQSLCSSVLLSYPSQAIPMFFCSPVLPLANNPHVLLFSCLIPRKQSPCSHVLLSSPKNMFFCLITMHIFLIPIKILNCFSLPFQISFIILYINILSLRKIENSIYTFYRNGTSTL